MMFVSFGSIDWTLLYACMCSECVSLMPQCLMKTDRQPMCLLAFH